MLKKVGFNIYSHKSNILEMVSNLSEKESIRLLWVLVEFYPTIHEEIGVDYCVLKYNKSNGYISLIESHDWDTINEPIVGNSVCIKPDNTYKYRKGGNQVYHNKWQFVSSDYQGFCIDKSKDRTNEWNRIANIKEHKSRIGNKTYWEQLLKNNGIEV